MDVVSVSATGWAVAMWTHPWQILDIKIFLVATDQRTTIKFIDGGRIESKETI